MSDNLATKVKGVYFDNHMQRYIGRMSINGKDFRKGFKTKEEAISYRKYLESLSFIATPPKETIDEGENNMILDEVKSAIEEKSFVERPKNFCRKDETFKYTYCQHTQKFVKENLATHEEEINSFYVPEVNFRLIYKDNVTVVIFEDGSKGIAKCGKDDTFSRKAGLKIAFARAMVEHLTNGAYIL